MLIRLYRYCSFKYYCTDHVDYDVDQVVPHLSL